VGFLLLGDFLFGFSRLIKIFLDWVSWTFLDFGGIFILIGIEERNFGEVLD
jgi:hypothetical protein